MAASTFYITCAMKGYWLQASYWSQWIIDWRKNQAEIQFDLFLMIFEDKFKEFGCMWKGNKDNKKEEETEES